MNPAASVSRGALGLSEVNTALPTQLRLAASRLLVGLWSRPGAGGRERESCPWARVRTVPRANELLSQPRKMETSSFGVPGWLRRAKCRSTLSRPHSELEMRKRWTGFRPEPSPGTMSRWAPRLLWKQQPASSRLASSKQVFLTGHLDILCYFYLFILDISLSDRFF